MATSLVSTGVKFPDDSVQTTAATAAAVLQVKSITDTTQRSTTSGNLTNSGISLSITPSSTSSKILVLATFTWGGSTSITYPWFGLRRGTTDIGLGSGTSNKDCATAGSWETSGTKLESGAMSFLDHPSTTSATTYHITFARGGGYLYLNRMSTAAGDGTTTLTLMEIAG